MWRGEHIGSQYRQAWKSGLYTFMGDKVLQDFLTACSVR